MARMSLPALLLLLQTQAYLSILTSHLHQQKLGEIPPSSDSVTSQLKKEEFESNPAKQCQHLSTIILFKSCTFVCGNNYTIEHQTKIDEKHQ